MGTAFPASAGADVGGRAYPPLMPALHPDVALSVRLDAICGANRYTRDPAPVVDELRAAAGDRTTLRDDVIGTWIGYFRGDETATLCDALLTAFPGAAAWVRVGEQRRGAPNHGTEWARQ